jgi:endonuclease-3 related protein
LTSRVDTGRSGLPAAVPAVAGVRARARLAIRDVFQALSQTYGPQHWWPADGPFEVMVGAVLTQNTAWSNVERALERLAVRGPLSPEALLGLSLAELAELIRPVGYYNVKARRLQAFCAAYREEGGLPGLAVRPTHELRRRLLRIHGVGPETADDMLLYAFGRPVFVVDAYTRRIFARLGLLAGDEGYEAIRHRFESTLGPDVALYNEYHALIVRHGKEVCRTRPRCLECHLRGRCATGREH